MSATSTDLNRIELTELPETIAGSSEARRIARSAEACESWSWRHVDEVAYVVNSEYGAAAGGHLDL
jgi:hypothetical protein